MRNIEYVIERFIQNLDPVREHPETRMEGAYSYIPLDPEKFVSLVYSASSIIRSANPNQEIDFLDVGCGTGVKMMLAQATIDYNCSVSGVEYNEKLVNRANQLFTKTPKIWVGDAMEYPDYDKHNLIYFYCPMEDRAKQVELEKLVYKKAKYGTVFIQVLKKNEKRVGEPYLRQVSRYNHPSLFVKSKSPLRVIEVVK